MCNPHNAENKYLKNENKKETHNKTRNITIKQCPHVIKTSMAFMSARTVFLLANKTVVLFIIFSFLYTVYSNKQPMLKIIQLALALINFHCRHALHFLLFYPFLYLRTFTQNTYAVYTHAMYRRI